MLFLAARQMPQAPSTEESIELQTSDGSKKQIVDEEDMIPCPEDMTALQSEPMHEIDQSPKRISAHELLVRAQISGSRQAKVPSDVSSLSAAMENRQYESKSREDLGELVEGENMQYDSGEPEDFVKMAAELELTLPELDDLTGSSSGLRKDDDYSDHLPMELSSHELSLPDLPSADEMVGLKLPDPTSIETRNESWDGIGAVGSQAQVEDQQSVTSSFSEPDFSSDEEGLQFKRDHMKEDVMQDAQINPEPVIEMSDIIDLQYKKPPATSESLIQISSSQPPKANRPKPPYFEVSLTKGPTGLGFTLAGGKSTTGKVKCIENSNLRTKINLKLFY